MLSGKIEIYKEYYNTSNVTRPNFDYTKKWREYDEIKKKAIDKGFVPGAVVRRVNSTHYQPVGTIVRFNQNINEAFDVQGEVTELFVQFQGWTANDTHEHFELLEAANAS